MWQVVGLTKFIYGQPVNDVLCYIAVVHELFKKLYFYNLKFLKVIVNHQVCIAHSINTEAAPPYRFERKTVGTLYHSKHIP